MGLFPHKSKKVRAARKDCTVGTFEKTRGLPTGTLRLDSGRKMRKDKTINSIRKEAKKKKSWF